MTGGLKLSATRRYSPLLLLFVALLVAALADCGGKGIPAIQQQTRPTLSQFISSRLSAAHPLQVGGYSIYSLDAQLRDDPQALKDIRAVFSKGVLTVTSLEDAPPSFSLYIRLPQGGYLNKLSVDAPPDILTLAVPGKIERVIPIGIAAVRGNASAQFTLTISTSAGLLSAQEPCAFAGSARISLPVKSASRPFEGESNRVFDLDVVPNGTYADLSWTERNIGDYNNSGFVDVSDITPLAIYFDQPADTPERQLVDGNDDDLIDIKDVTQIAMNYGSTISGYEVVAVSIPSLAYTPTDDELFAATPYPDPDNPSEPDPSVKRAKFYIGGQPPKVRISYAFGHNMNAGIYAFAVRPYSFLGDDMAGALFSNIAKADFSTGGNNPPVWIGQPGLRAAAGGNQKVTLTFGDATDPDGDAVHFIVYWEQNTTVYPPVAQSQRFDRAALGTPPFSAVITGLTNDLPYTFMVWAFDEHDLRENPPNEIDLTATPRLYEPNTHPWPYLHKDEQRSGLLAEGLREPLVELWKKPYKSGGTYNESSPVLDEDNVYIGSCDGYVYAFSQADGSLALAPTYVDSFLSSSTAALWGDYLVIGAPGKYSVLDIPSSTALGSVDLISDNPVRSSPLIVSRIAYCGSEDDAFYAFDIATRDKPPDWVNPDFGSVTSGSAASDGTYIYIASENGYAHKLNAETGEEMATSPDLGSITYGTPTLFPEDAPVAVIIGADTKAPQSKVYALAASDMQIITDYDTQFGVQGAPVVVDDGTRNLVIVGEGEIVPSPAVGRGYVSAFDLDTGALIWRTDDVGRIFASPVASADRIFVGSQNGHFYVLDFQGRIKQDINLHYPVYASAALNGGLVFVPSTEMMLYCFQAQPDTEPPVWQGPEGVSEVTTGFGEATVHWGYATDNFYSPVYYQLYYSADDITSLWAAPKVIDIQGDAAITHEYTVTGLTDGTRYYFSVRASDRPLWDSPNIELNTNFIGATPPWNLRAQLDLADELPSVPADTVITYMATDVSAPDGLLRLSYAVEGGANELQYAMFDGNTVVPDAAITAPAGVIRCLEMGQDASGYPNLSFADSLDYIYAVRDNLGIWGVDSISASTVPTQPAFFSIFGTAKRLQAFFNQVIPLPNESVALDARRGDLLLWNSYEEPDAALDKGIHLKTALVDYNDGNGETPLIFYEKADEYYTGSTMPEKGSLWLARYDEVGGTWIASELDAGADANSNTGRNLQILVDDSLTPPVVHLAYYDLHATDPVVTAVLRHATYDGTNFAADDVALVNLPNPAGSASVYYHNPALSLVDGNIALATYSRNSDPLSPTAALNFCNVIYCRPLSPNSWAAEKVVENTAAFLHFNAPLGLETCYAVSSYPLLVFPVDGDGLIDGADAIQIWQRGPL
jgi:outer membrane protein assembly factor BamB